MHDDSTRATAAAAAGTEGAGITTVDGVSSKGRAGLLQGGGAGASIVEQPLMTLCPLRGGGGYFLTSFLVSGGTFYHSHCGQCKGTLHVGALLDS